MMEILQFIFSGFWIWLGTVILILAVGEAVEAIVSAFLPSREIKIVNQLDSPEFEKAVCAAVTKNIQSNGQAQIVVSRAIND